MDHTKEKTIQIKDNVQRQSVRKKQRNRKLKRTLGILFAVLYLPALWHWVFHGGIETGILHSGTMEMKLTVEGVFIRSESPVKASLEGIVLPAVNHGDRVPNQYSFAKIVEKSSLPALQRIESLERDIIRQTADELPNILDGDKVFRDKVQKEVGRLTVMAQNQNLFSVEIASTALQKLLYLRNKEIFEKQDTRPYLQNEKQVLEQLRNSINEKAIEVPADFSGLVAWDTEPYDDRFKRENMEKLSEEDVIVGSGNDETGKSTGIVAGEYLQVEEGQIFARLVDNEKSWFVFMADRKDEERFKPGSSLLLRVEGLNKEIPCIVESVHAQGEKRKIILYFNRMIEETIDMRHVRADLIFNSVYGIKIPVRSLKNYNQNDGTADVVIVRFERAHIKRVKVLYMMDAYAVIEAAENFNTTDPVKVFDVYVVHPENIVEGQMIE